MSWAARRVSELSTAALSWTWSSAPRDRPIQSRARSTEQRPQGGVQNLARQHPSEDRDDECGDGLSEGMSLRMLRIRRAGADMEGPHQGHPTYHIEERIRGLGKCELRAEDAVYPEESSRLPRLAARVKRRGAVSCPWTAILRCAAIAAPAPAVRVPAAPRKSCGSPRRRGKYCASRAVSVNYRKYWHADCGAPPIGSIYSKRTEALTEIFPAARSRRTQGKPT